MARLIRVNGEDRTITPTSREFTNKELHELMSCRYLTGINLGGPEGLYMFIDDTGLIDGKPVNEKATEIARTYKPGYPHKVHGDVVIANLRESGEE